VIRIITVEREYGCGGGIIAQKLAARLEWKLWDQLLTSEIARFSHCHESQVELRQERVDPLYYRLLKSVMRGSYEGSLNLPRLKLLDADTILRVSERVIQQAAAEGNCVIVGRGSQHFLRDREDTLRVFLYAPDESKVRRLRSEGMSQKEAEESVRTIDSERAAFIERYFNLQWPTRSTYHAMLNTAFGEETVVATIIRLKDALDTGTE
jgi:cytidylate kinase-like protein